MDRRAEPDVQLILQQLHSPVKVAGTSNARMIQCQYGIAFTHMVEDDTIIDFKTSDGEHVALCFDNRTQTMHYVL